MGARPHAPMARPRAGDGAPDDDMPAVLRAALAGRALVNLTGPLGSGKSWLAARVPGAVVVDLARPGAEGALRGAPGADERPLVIDGVDGPGAPAAVAFLAAPAHRPRRPVLLVSRRPLAADPVWAEADAGAETATVTVPPWPDGRIARLPAVARLDDPRARRLATGLSGGNPLLATAVCRALRAGAPHRAPGAVADRVVGEVLHRLAREAAGRHWHRSFFLLATVGAGDEVLLRGGAGAFDALAALSVVTRGPLGLALDEPFRNLVELAHQWRRPGPHRAARRRALTYRADQLARTADARDREELALQGILLSGVPELRATLFPPARPVAAVSAAVPGDADAIGRLMRRWADHGGLDAGRTDRLVERWLRADVSGFRLVRDGRGRLTGLAWLPNVDGRTVGGVEPLLQQHTERLVAGPRDEPGGLLFLGAAYCPDPALHALLLRYILRQTMTGSARLLVSTPSPEYQRLLHGLRFRAHGATRDDVYRCGRRPLVFSHDFGGDDLTHWLTRLAPAVPPSAGGPGGPSPAGEIAEALAHVRDPLRLADSPLLRAGRTPTARALRDWLAEAVRALAGSEDPVDAEAGLILSRYYFGPPRTHQQLAGQLHLSRATYFRRLRHGLTVLAERLHAPD
ncbi:hypothetical protein [Streptomyces sp. RFCAC02]|uniref:hypothetical protein n=1 Tax=Streptomyces sp. RFCAC02 TaxID=2499143 RepID=UPI001F0E6A53|nr:hypothetical protein [Streptomyces sp. RFCAC02]